MTPAEPDSVRDVRAALTAARGAARTFVWSAERDAGETAEQAVRRLLARPPAPLIGTAHADFVLRERGVDPDGGLAHLRMIDRDTAQVVLTSVLHRDLAYNASIVDLVEAQRLARQAVNVMQRSAQWWTNGTFETRSEAGHAFWIGLTGATFDAGCIGVDDQRILVLWVMDED